MKQKGLSRRLVGMCLVLLLAVSVIAVGCPPVEVDPVAPVPDPEPEVFRWKMQSYVPAGHTHMVYGQDHFVYMVEKLTGGRVIIASHGAGELVPAMDVGMSVTARILDMGMWWSGFDYGIDPVGGLLAGAPFGWDLTTFPGWWFEFGGKQLVQEFYDRLNTHIVGMFIDPTGPFMYWTERVATVEDMKGRTIRMVGLPPKIVEAADIGVAIKMVPGGEIFMAMEFGVVDGGEFGSPRANVALGLHLVGPYHMTPGWHEPVMPILFTVNKDAWQALPEDLQFLVEQAARDTFLHVLTTMIVGNAKAYLETLEHSEAIRLPDADLALFYDATQAYMDARAAECEFYARVLQHVRDFDVLTLPLLDLWDHTFERP